MTLNQEIEDRQMVLNTIISESDFSLDPAGEALLKRRQTLGGQYNALVGRRIGLEAAYKGLSLEPLHLRPFGGVGVELRFVLALQLKDICLQRSDDAAGAGVGEALRATMRTLDSCDDWTREATSEIRR